MKPPPEPNNSPPTSSPKTDNENFSLCDNFPTYQIDHARDFLQVPEDRLSQCLVEFADFLALARELNHLVEAVGKTVGLAEECGEVGAYTWTDDGKLNRVVSIGVKGETK
jgi:hypothetical protein